MVRLLILREMEGAVLEPLLERADHVGALGDVRPTTHEIVVRETR